MAGYSFSPFFSIEYLFVKIKLILIYNNKRVSIKFIRNFTLMLKKLLKKLSPKKKSLEDLEPPTGKSLRQKCQSITQQFPVFAQSTYFTTHLPLILQPESIVPILEKKVKHIQKGIKQNSAYEIQLASIIMNITEENGLFFIFVKLWISFCQFELKKIVEEKGIGRKVIFKEDDKKKQSKNQNKGTEIEMKDIQNNHEKVKSQKIIKIFHKEFFLLCYFIYELCLYLYDSAFSQEGLFQPRDLFILIRNTITTVREWSKVHEIFRKEVRCQSQQFTQSEVKLNMSQLEKTCKISKIPAPFLDSINILNQFSKTPSIEDKLKKSVKLLQTLKQEMLEYRKINGMPTEYIFCADDVLSALTLAMWRLRKNIYGASVYAEVVLCCEFETVDQEKLAEELNAFGDSVRHSFDTVRSVARIGLLQEDKIYSIV